jgi:phage/plasmid-like protein (TIGR03299 family)
VAHLIDMTSGDAAIAYNKRETPWHGLGNPVGDEIDVDGMLVAAKLDWPVHTSPVLYQVPDETFAGKAIRDPDHRVMFRGDTRVVLDIVGKGYVPHQNSEVLEFFREYLAAGEMTLDVAGSLNGGKMIWGLGKMKEGFVLPGNDVVGGYVLLVNPHMYGKAMTAKFTSVRAVCWNTISMALAGGGDQVKLWHTAELNETRRKEAKQKLGIAREQLDSHAADALILATTQIPVEDAIPVLAATFGMKDAKDVTDADALPRAGQRVLALWQGAGLGAALESSTGTAWGLLNGLTQYLDHEHARTADARLTNTWLGKGERQKRDLLGRLLVEARAGGD